MVSEGRPAAVLMIDRNAWRPFSLWTTRERGLSPWTCACGTTTLQPGIDLFEWRWITSAHTTGHHPQPARGCRTQVRCQACAKKAAA